MRRKRFVIFVSAVLACLTGVAHVVWPGPESAINAANAARIREGMSLAEVEALLGGPERDESGGPLAAITPDGPSEWRVHGFLYPPEAVSGVPMVTYRPRRCIWTSDRLIVAVRLNFDGRVESCSSLPVRRIRESPLDAVRRWLNL